MPSYSPAEAVARSGFTIETLRYYERIGLLRDVRRDPAGRRVFDDGHLSWLQILRCRRDTGMPIAQMQRYVQLATGDGPAAERVGLLRAHERAVTRQLAELRRWRRHLREKIAHYEGGPAGPTGDAR